MPVFLVEPWKRGFVDENGAEFKTQDEAAPPDQATVRQTNASFMAGLMMCGFMIEPLTPRKSSRAILR